MPAPAQVPQETREELEARFRALQDSRGVRFSERGFETIYTAYRGIVAKGRAEGKRTYLTTNAQRAAGMEERGRPRSLRTMQRTHRTLAEMGLPIGISHVRRGRATPGWCDCLRVTFRQTFHARRRKRPGCDPSTSFVTPPTATGVGTLRVLTTPVRTAKTASDCAAFGGRDRPPDKPAGNGSDEEESAQAPMFDMVANRQRIQRELEAGQRTSIFERYGVSLE